MLDPVSIGAGASWPLPNVGGVQVFPFASVNDGAPHTGPGASHGYSTISQVSGPASPATPFGFAITSGDAWTIGNAPLFAALAEPLTSSHCPTLPPVTPVIVIQGELTGVPLVAGTQTPLTFCPGDLYDPAAAVVVAAPVPLETSTGAW